MGRKEVAMINSGNYFISSRGVFQPLPRKVLDAVLTLRPEIELNGRRWFLNHVSRSCDSFEAEPTPSSIYYVSGDGQWLIRASDHWCVAKRNVHLAAHRCKRIANCRWEIPRKAVRESRGRFLAAVIKFSDLTENR